MMAAWRRRTEAALDDFPAKALRMIRMNPSKPGQGRALVLRDPSAFEHDLAEGIWVRIPDRPGEWRCLDEETISQLIDGLVARRRIGVQTIVKPEIMRDYVVVREEHLIPPGVYVRERHVNKRTDELWRRKDK